MASKYDFSGTLALVTGGGSGMGRAVCQALAEAGATVIVADINANGATETVQMLKGKDHIAVKVDVASETSVKDLSTHITSKYNRCPSTVIHAAGIIATGARKSVFEITAQDYDRTLDINLKGTFLINKIFGQRMRDEKVENGSIVNFSSVAGRTGVPYVAEYSASKTGVNSLTESFGKELAQSGIRVNAVAPFFVRTPLLDVFPEHKLEQAVAFSPSQRMGKPEEIARVCLFLASKDSAYISGQILHVTGGF